MLTLYLCHHVTPVIIVRF